ncbi:MAG: double zinc ribbon domain-containing protein [Phycisphaerae bacterium]
MTIENTQTILHGASPVPAVGRQVGRFARRAVDLLFPARCPLCAGPAEGQTTTAPLCADCVPIVQQDRDREACPRCAASVAPYEVTDGRCRWCRRRRVRVRGTVRVGEYSRGVGELVRLFKYRGQERLGCSLGLWLADAARGASWLDRVEAVVSVPTHWRRSLRWPVHAADALAAIVARDIRLPHLPVLHRIKAGPHQIGLSYLDRRRNVRGAFALRRGVALHGARLLLVDDVKTTGATINECAKILRQGGAGEVYAAVLVTVPPDRARLNASPGT